MYARTLAVSDGVVVFHIERQDAKQRTFGGRVSDEEEVIGVSPHWGRMI